MAGNWEVILEINPSGEVYSHVLGLPGCIVRARSEPAALESLDNAIRQYRYWFAAHTGDSLSEPGDFPQVIKTVAGGASSGTGSQVALLLTDCDRLDDAERSDLLARMEYSRSDLLEIVMALTLDELSIRAHPDHRSIAEILLHLSEADQWYLSRIENRPRRFFQTGPIPRLAAVRKKVLAGFSDYPLDVSGNIHTQAGEEWTLRKAFRRALEHEREHYLEILQTLSLSGCARFPAWMDPDGILREIHLAQVSDF